MSSDPEQEYFADGMVEDIIAGLSRISWLPVIARNSSFAYKDKTADAKRIGRDLGVRYLLEGSVRKTGPRVRVTVELIDAETGIHLWVERYDRQLDDIFALQDEIAMSVVGAIEPNLRKAELERIKRKRPDSLDAYDLVLQALPYAYSHMPDKAAIAIPLLEKALGPRARLCGRACAFGAVLPRALWPRRLARGRSCRRHSPRPCGDRWRR